LSLGGDHSVSFPAIAAHAEKHNSLSILHIDAHPDLYDDMQGNPHSHASPFARLMEGGRIDRLVQVGIRTLNGHQREQAALFGVGAVLDIIHNFGGSLIGADVVELNPHRDPGNITAMVATKFVKEIMGRMLADRK